MVSLKSLNVVVGDDNIASKIFEGLFPSFYDVAYKKPSEYVEKYWNAYEAYCLNKPVNPNNNGKVFEYILATLLIRENIVPFFLSAKVAFVPNVVYDILLYTKIRGPICISAKTSLRERYKQADLEGIALKYVHRRSLCYLVTNHEKEAASVRAKINTGDVIGLDDVLFSVSADFDNMIAQLKTFDFENPKPINIINSNQIITGSINAT
ncbi:MAG: hypothetical protein HC817_00930 [Saprospiraceae bacterium]|nr:hypothetical protein [Saprospiraceae bacterium]